MHDTFTLRGYFNNAQISNEYTASQIVDLGIMLLKGKSSSELDYLQFVEPEVFEVFERLRTRATGVTAADLAQSRGHATVAEAVRRGSSTEDAAAAGAVGPAEGAIAIPSTGKETFSGMNEQDTHDTFTTLRKFVNIAMMLCSTVLKLAMMLLKLLLPSWPA